jgi:hypothetical protein
MVRQAHHDICHPELVEGWKRGARGDFLINVYSIMRPLIITLTLLCVDFIGYFEVAGFRTYEGD